MEKKITLIPSQQGGTFPGNPIASKRVLMSFILRQNTPTSAYLDLIVNLRDNTSLINRVFQIYGNPEQQALRKVVYGKIIGRKTNMAKQTQAKKEETVKSPAFRIAKIQRQLADYNSQKAILDKRLDNLTLDSFIRRESEKTLGQVNAKIEELNQALAEVQKETV